MARGEEKARRDDAQVRLRKKRVFVASVFEFGLYNPKMRAIIRRRSKNDNKLYVRKKAMADIIKALEAKTNEKIPGLASGDMVSVHVKIKEGERERIQEFKGTIIRLRKGGNDASMTVRRMASNGIGVERTFLLRSPRIDKVVVERLSQVRRAQLYFMRERTGKSARLKQKFD
jgi:large subunit ribosomal protein L19